jgi:hypothetical protein
MRNPKIVEDKLQTILQVWASLRPDSSFAGMTLAQFTAAVQPSLDRRAEIDDLNTQLVAKQDQRDAADETSLETYKKVVNGVRAVEGENSSVLEALGYVLAKERKTGLTRKANGGGTVPAHS